MQVEQKVRISAKIITILPTGLIALFLFPFLISSFELSEQDQFICNQLNVICDSYLPPLILGGLIILMVFYLFCSICLEMFLSNLFYEEKLT